MMISGHGSGPTGELSRSWGTILDLGGRDQLILAGVLQGDGLHRSQGDNYPMVRHEQLRPDGVLAMELQGQVVVPCHVVQRRTGGSMGWKTQISKFGLSQAAPAAPPPSYVFRRSPGHPFRVAATRNRAPAVLGLSGSQNLLTGPTNRIVQWAWGDPSGGHVTSVTGWRLIPLVEEVFVASTTW